MQFSYPIAHKFMFILDYTYFHFIFYYFKGLVSKGDNTINGKKYVAQSFDQFFKSFYI